MTARRWLVVVVVAATAAACTTADRADPEQPSALDTAAAMSPDVAEPGPTSTAPATPQQAALAAYEEYTATTVDALSSGEADLGRLSAVADDQALRHARRRLRANRRDDVVVTGTLTTSATATDVEVDGARTARLHDCVLNGLEQVAADDPNRVVSAATGWRQPVEATVENRDGDWVVTRVTVPLRDGSGAVPPPPDDPPYLRGPAQGPAPPSCVPDDLADEAIEGYEAFITAYNDALGFGRRGAADPASPKLADTAVDPQLSAAQEFAESLAARGLAFRGEPNAHDPWAIATNMSDRRVEVYDCVTIGEYGQADPAATEAATNPEAGAMRLDAAGVVRHGDSWKVAGVSVLEDGLEECTSPAKPQQ